MSSPLERDVAHLGDTWCSFRSDAIETSVRARRRYEEAPNVIASDQMPFEKSPDGLIKHLVNERMASKECCVEAYMQFMPAHGRSGRHRHMWEEVLFVLEGSGHDLHWDLRFDCVDKFEYQWEPVPKRYEWQRGDFIYVPPFTIHQHHNDGEAEARLIVISNRIVKAMGFDWLDQLEHAPGY
ncbi:MAG: cupin domain-containing protein [Steroidobacteraceae bacterium]